MPDSNNILLQTLVDDVREVRNDVKNLLSNQVTRTEFDELTDTVNDHALALQGHGKILNSGAWVIKVAVAAVLAELVLLSFAFFHVPTNAGYPPQTGQSISAATNVGHK